jgi:hypothetical protein
VSAIELIGLFIITVFFSGVSFFHFSSRPGEGPLHFIALIAIGMGYYFSSVTVDFLGLESFSFQVLFFVLPHAIGLGCAYLVCRRIGSNQP